MEDRLARFEMDRDRKDKELNEKYETLRVGLENEALAREILQERKLKELKLVESGVTLDLNLERQGRMEAEMRVAKSLDDRCIALSVELGAHTYGAGAGGGGGAARGEQGDDSRVLEALAAERDRRLQEEERIMQKLDEDSKVIFELLERERQVREEATRGLVVTIEKFGQRLHSEISHERQEREATEETILRILDETAGRVEKSLWKPKK